ncbi:hypothetical protein FOMPIDRAFT_1047749 [Fomitopsis schrenkii]|uniref:F-box domain-containing protein n=1 Tax=Fomitopsis schrenkii TaxID=2126942 RepID=S8EHI3_FOMSC|nr:hypothetical protein FOMPIDRAFT_1047749 [Fomitopsis schrenkii]
MSSLHESSARTFLGQIALVVPDLQVLELWSTSDVLPYSIIPFALTCRDLRRVLFGSPQFKGYHAQFSALASIEKLTDLRITVLDDDELTSEDVISIPLPALEKLALRCSDTWSVKDVIRAIGPVDRPYPGLKVLRIEFNGLDQGIVSALDFLRPLLQMRNLRIVTIATERLSWSDDGMASLASAWPTLVSLKIRWYISSSLEGSECAMPAIPTLGILPRIAKSCPRLRTALSLSALGLTWNESVENVANLSHTVFDVLLINRMFAAPSIPSRFSAPQGARGKRYWTRSNCFRQPGNRRLVL